MARRTPDIVGLTAVCIAAAFVPRATPQPLDYHDFADHRALFGSPRSSTSPRTSA